MTAMLLLLAGAMTLTSCGGTGSSDTPPPVLTLSGNWQFTVAPPPDGSFVGGVQGGFLLQKGGAVTGAAVYAVSPPQLGYPCNSGSAPITGTLSGQAVTLTAVAGTQTFSFTGSLSSDGSTISGTYASTAGTAADGSACGTAQTGLQWSAILVPPITGSIQGSFHSTGGVAGLANQDFLVTGSLLQSENVGASNASVTGTLSFLNATTNLSDYPCFTLAAVNGQISGNSVILQIIGTDGSNLGQIGEPSGQGFVGTTGLNPVTYNSAQGGYILHGAGPSYLVASKSCGGSLGSTTTAGDFGNLCLSVGGGSACQQTIALSPAVLTFPGQLLNTTPTTQTIAVENLSNATMNNLTLTFVNEGDNSFGGQSDFTGLPSFTEMDTCASVPGTPFTLLTGQSCQVAITFNPQQGCPWIPYGTPPSVTGATPEWCPLPQGAEITVTAPTSPDGNTTYAAPITGIGLSAIQPSTHELDFGAEEQLNPPEASVPQTVSFTNTSNFSLQILGRAACLNPAKGQNVLPHPLLAGSPVAGLQVVSNGSGSLPISADGNTITYNCDSDSGTLLPNFQISSDSCTGTVLAPQMSCSLQIAYVPQPNTNIGNGLDYFLELNTVQCSGSMTTNCELDSGRFPVELRSNPPSPLRMTPGAGLDFGNQAVGKTSVAQTVTLLNDPNLETPQPISLVGKITVQGNYSETDDCPVTLAPGNSCTLTVTFKPGTVGFLPGSLTINYTPEPFGVPQIVYLRGTGQ